ncbi:MAG: hypothetical protein ACK5NA_07335 [Enterococcus sp.]
MKKFYLLLAIPLLLSGCSSTNESTDATKSSTSQTSEVSSTTSSTTTAESTSESTVSTTKSTGEESTTSSKQPESTTTTKTSVAPSTSETTTSSKESTQETTQSSQTQETTTLDELKSTYPNVVLPTTVPLSSNNVLSAATAQEGDTLSILYYGTPTKLPVNDASLNQSTPSASYQANGELNEFSIDSSARAVDLGHSITGYQQGAAGSSYIEWQEGNWNIRVRASNLENQDPLPTAKEVVDYLETNALPAPTKGFILIDMTQQSYEANQVNWQVGNQVYKVTNADSIPALQMAVSMNH